MTIKLAVDNVTPIPCSNLRDVAAMARKFADDLDAGQYGEVNRVVVIAENGDGISIFGWGVATTAYELMGLFEASKLRVFADDLVDDD